MVHEDSNIGFVKTFFHDEVTFDATNSKIGTELPKTSLFGTDFFIFAV